MKRAARSNATWIVLLASLTMAGGQTAPPAPDAPPSPALPANPSPALAAPAATSKPRCRSLEGWHHDSGCRRQAAADRRHAEDDRRRQEEEPSARLRSQRPCPRRLSRDDR